MTFSRRLVVAVAAVGLFLAGCASDERDRESSPDGDGNGSVRIDVLASGLDRPTQLAIAPDGAWYVAQLAGEENDARGQIVRLDPTDLDRDPVVVLDGLDKPTGVAVFADELWVMERRRLTRGPLDGSRREIVVDEMAHNGRSEGTLTIVGDELFFDTSGSSRVGTGPGGDPVTTSGALWAIDAEGTIRQVAYGFKHAYAQAVGADGTIWTTELADGSPDGEPALDEVLVVRPGADHGWPACVDDNRPVAELGATAASCAGVPRSHALFAARATPTGIAVAPWDQSQLVVALWVERRIVSIPIDATETPVTETLVSDQVGRPQHLVADGDRLLVTDHEAGEILSLRQG